MRVDLRRLIAIACGWSWVVSCMFDSLPWSTRVARRVWKEEERMMVLL